MAQNRVRGWPAKGCTIFGDGGRGGMQAGRRQHVRAGVRAGVPPAHMLAFKKSPWPFWWGGKAAIRLIEGPVAYCTNLEAVPLAAAWFKAGGEIRICLAECLRSVGVNQGHLWLRCPGVI